MSDGLRTFEELGNEILSRRQKKRMSLNDVSEKTKIRAQFIEAIETGDIGSLPGDLYARGFIRTYLELLGSLDLWPEYESGLKETSSGKSKESVVHYFPTQKGFHKVSRLWIFAFLFLGIVASLYMIWQQKDSLTAQMGSVPDLSQEIPGTEPSDAIILEPDTPGPQVEKTETPLSPGKIQIKDGEDKLPEGSDTSWLPGHKEEVASKAGVLSINASGPCWISVSSDGGNSFQRTLSKGDRLEVNVEGKTSIRFGNAGAVTLLWGGNEIGNIGRAGEVVNIVLLPDGTLERQ